MEVGCGLLAARTGGGEHVQLMVNGLKSFSFTT
jgi:hypothetical protein